MDTISLGDDWIMEHITHDVTALQTGIENATATRTGGDVEICPFGKREGIYEGEYPHYGLSIPNRSPHD